MNIIELLQYDFFQKALIASVLVSVATGIIGTIIVIKKMSLVSGSIAHSAFGGLGISYYLGLSPLIGALSFSTFSALVISYLRNKQDKNLDTLLSILWSVGMSVGLIFMFITPGYNADLFSFLFGDILLIKSVDLWFMFALDVIIVAVVYLIYNALVSTIFDEEASTVRNLPTKLIYSIILLLTAFAIVIVIRLVGIILMLALFTIPAATAIRFVKKTWQIMLLSTFITIIGLVGGLAVSTIVNWPASPVIVLFLAVIYITWQNRRS